MAQGPIPPNVWVDALREQTRRELKPIIEKVVAEEIDKAVDAAIDALQIRAETFFSPMDYHNIVRYVVEKKDV